MKIKNKIFTEVVLSVLRLGLKFSNPALAAWALAFAAIEFNQAEGKKVLCLGRSIFLDDVRAMTRASGQIKYYILHLTYFGIMFDYFVSRADRQKITEDNYYIDNFGSAGKKKYNEFLKKMMPVLQRRLGFKAILSGSFGYIMQQEVENAARDLNVPFMIMHKEGLGAYGDYVDMNLFNHYEFHGAKILLYNNQIKNALLKHLYNLTEDKLEVVGIPRFDFYFANNDRENPVKQVLFFSFHYEDRFFSLIQDEEKLKQARSACASFHKLIMGFARRNKEIKVIIKTKASEHYLQYVKDIFNDNFSEPIPNLEITNLGNPVEMIKNSLAVIGFNSTVSIEAVAAGKTLVSPDFRQTVTNKSWNFFDRYPDLVNYAVTVSDLERYIKNYRDYASSRSDSRVKFLSEFIHIPDGRASFRAEEAILRTIREHEK